MVTRRACALRLTAQNSSLVERLETVTKAVGEWESVGAKRLAEVERLLNEENFAAQARSKLSKLDTELATLGYDAAAHDAARLTEQNGRTAEADFRALESARAALVQAQAARYARDRALADGSFQIFVIVQLAMMLAQRLDL